MTDLEARILRAVVSTKIQTDIPAAVISAIERTHRLVPIDDPKREWPVGELQFVDLD